MLQKLTMHMKFRYKRMQATYNANDAQELSMTRVIRL